ncbi:hypothetical protein [Muricoccus radiodurans]|uniref:hypothetical protein n=1 Tax=Muricoccus radiodurans TaxID=2231721 RepID=UPI003CF3635F
MDGHAAKDGACTGLCDILGAVGREASDLARMAAGLQAALPVPGTRLCARTVESLQSLDLLTQRLQGLADFLDALAPTLPPAWRADVAAAVRGLTLSGLARRLSGAGIEEPGAVEDCELFEAGGV